MKIVQVDAFSNVPFEGNPAAVVLLDKDLNREIYLNIAKEMNLSETAFVKKIDTEDAMFEIRYFTITDEVDMCGHATISSLSVINKLYTLPSDFSIKTKAGIIDVSIKSNDGKTTYFIKQPSGQFKTIDVSRETLEKVLNVEEAKFKNSYGVEPIVYSTGLYDLLVPVESRKILNDIEIDKELMILDSKEKNMVGYHCYTLEDGIIYVRNFAPLYGIDEEAATGTSNGALLTLLYQRGKIKKGEYKIIQGEKMGKATNIYGRIDEDGIWIGGECYELFTGDLNI